MQHLPHWVHLNRNPSTYHGAVAGSSMSFPYDGFCMTNESMVIGRVNGRESSEVVMVRDRRWRGDVDGMRSQVSHESVGAESSALAAEKTCSSASSRTTIPVMTTVCRS